jgi:hypothetical protein
MLYGRMARRVYSHHPLGRMTNFPETGKIVHAFIVDEPVRHDSSKSPLLEMTSLCGKVVARRWTVDVWDVSWPKRLVKTCKQFDFYMHPCRSCKKRHYDARVVEILAGVET